MLNIEQMLWAFQVAAIAQGFLLLTERGHIFAAYGIWLDKNEYRLKKAYKPLGGCGLCFAGQAGFWIGAATFGLSLKVVTFCFLTILFYQLFKRLQH